LGRISRPEDMPQATRMGPDNWKPEYSGRVISNLYRMNWDAIQPSAQPIYIEDLRAEHIGWAVVTDKEIVLPDRRYPISAEILKDKDKFILKRYFVADPRQGGEAIRITVEDLQETR
jgi:hypothetical protein